MSWWLKAAIGSMAEIIGLDHAPAARLSQLSVSGLADGGLTPMTKTEVTRIIRIVFLFWLVVLIALVLTTIVALLPLPDQIHGHGHEKTWKESFAHGESK
jgi:hypothetical protein